MGYDLSVVFQQSSKMSRFAAIKFKKYCIINKIRVLFDVLTSSEWGIIIFKL